MPPGDISERLIRYPQDPLQYSSADTVTGSGTREDAAQYQED